jgi:hypothetical protein
MISKLLDGSVFSASSSFLISTKLLKQGTQNL